MRGVLVVLLGALLLGTGAARAEPPSRVAGAVTDSAGVLAAGDEARITEAFARLREANGTQLFVVYVGSFDGADGQEWADEAASLSQFGRDDVLLAVAVQDRAYGVSFDQDYPPSAAAERAAEDRLAVDDWAGAAIALADGLGGGSSGFPVGWLLVGGIAVAGGGAYLVARRRGRVPAVQPAPRDEFTDVPTDDLAYRASAALIEVDEAVRTSEVELTAARDHFGAAAVAGFTAAVQQSRADMLRAFGVRQQLDDDEPEDEPARRAMFAEIVRACRSADERLDAQVAEFDALRGLEARAPEYVSGLGTRHGAVAARVPEAQAALAALSGRYGASALEPLPADVEQARRLLADAGVEIDAARAELDAGRRAAAVVSGRAAEDALTQAAVLLDTVPRRGTELADAAARLPAARAEAEQDLAEARALGTLGPVVARAEAALGAAADVETVDPMAALRLLDEAEDTLDAAIAEGRRTAALLDRTLVTARSSVAAATDFVATRRGAVGASARTRLADAQRHLQHATAGGEPAVALREAQQADARAQEALRLARSDATGFTTPGGPGADLGSLILGGIISGAVSGALRGGGGGRGFGGPAAGRFPGSFGGSASRGRRGGGGRF